MQSAGKSRLGGQAPGVQLHPRPDRVFSPGQLLVHSGPRFSWKEEPCLPFPPSSETPGGQRAPRSCRPHWVWLLALGRVSWQHLPSLLTQAGATARWVPSTPRLKGLVPPPASSSLSSPWCFPPLSIPPPHNPIEGCFIGHHTFQTLPPTVPSSSPFLTFRAPFPPTQHSFLAYFLPLKSRTFPVAPAMPIPHAARSHTTTRPSLSSTESFGTCLGPQWSAPLSTIVK